MDETQPGKVKDIALKATWKKGESSSKHKSPTLNSLANINDDTSSHDGDVSHNELNWLSSQGKFKEC